MMPEHVVFALKVQMASVCRQFAQHNAPRAWCLRRPSYVAVTETELPDWVFIEGPPGFNWPPLKEKS